MEEPILDDEERGIVRRFAKRYLDHQEEIGYEEYEPELRLNAIKHRSLVSRLKNQGLIQDGIADGDIRVLPKCVELVRQWDNPPLRDRWDEATKWFRSRWWSLPCLVLLVGLPAQLKGWVDVIKGLLEWMTHGGK